VTAISRVKLIPRQLRADSRGWFLKVIDGKEEGLPLSTGEVYLTLAEPGHWRGKHFHPLAQEWFAVVQGSADVVLQDVATGEVRRLVLSAKSPETLYVPPGVAHVFHNRADATEPMLLVAYTDRLYDPADTIFHEFP
jgi:UDP-2-acetamido-2,6-beta-L-arabino-hexul-4-ose reductase